jgi:hypothetical protein
MTDAQLDALALWIAHTYAIDAAETTPYVAVTSALKRSGKSRLREVLERLVRQPLSASNISDAALFRAVAKLTPTLLLDEADAVFKAREREDLRGMLNAGYRHGAVVYRMGGASKTKLEAFPVFCAKAFFGIGDFLPDTLVDRAIPIRLERRTQQEPVERFRQRETSAETSALSDRLAEWIEPLLDDLKGAWPTLPQDLDDRAQDSWEPLFAIADVAGGDWPDRARGAARVLSAGVEREEDSAIVRLLRDIQVVFRKHDDRLSTGELLRHLHRMDESPWGEWRGKPLTGHGLSKLLKPYRIRTMTVRVDGTPVKGYKEEQFADAFARVLGVTAVTRVTSKSSSETRSNPSNPRNPPSVDRPPTPGEDGFLERLDALRSRGLITDAESDERAAIHRLVLRRRAQ